MPAPLISINDARRLVLDAVAPLGTETIALDDALGRVLAEDVSAAGDVPPFPCSANMRLIVAPVPTGTVDFITSA